MTTAPELKTDYDTHTAQDDASPTLTRPEKEPFMSMFELDGKWAVRVDGITAFLPEKHLMANMPAQAIIQAVMGAVNNAVEHKNTGTTSLGSAVLDTNGLPRDLNVPKKTDGDTMDQGLKTADSKSVGSQLAASGAFGQSSPPVDNQSIRPSTAPTAEFAHNDSKSGDSKKQSTASGTGSYGTSDQPRATYDAADVEKFKDDGKSPIPDKKPTTLPPKDSDTKKAHK